MLYRPGHEKNALDAFFDIFMETFINAELASVGLVLFRDTLFIGGSPDAIARCECCHHPYLVKVKYPLVVCNSAFLNRNFRTHLWVPP